MSKTARLSNEHHTCSSNIPAMLLLSLYMVKGRSNVVMQLSGDSLQCKLSTHGHTATIGEQKGWKLHCRIRTTSVKLPPHTLQKRLHAAIGLGFNVVTRVFYFVWCPTPSNTTSTITYFDNTCSDCPDYKVWITYGAADMGGSSLGTRYE